jgi:hypothetical protein
MRTFCIIWISLPFHALVLNVDHIIFLTEYLEMKSIQEIIFL